LAFQMPAERDCRHVYWGSTEPAHYVQKGVYRLHLQTGNVGCRRSRVGAAVD